jgi:hypothetical protein
MRRKPAELDDRSALFAFAEITSMPRAVPTMDTNAVSEELLDGRQWPTPICRSVTSFKARQSMAFRRYSLGATPKIRLKVLLNAASES